MEAIMKWLMPTKFYEVKSFFGEAQYLRKFIATISTIAVPLHAITTNNKRSWWEKCQQRSIEELKKKINQSLVVITKVSSNTQIILIKGK